MRSCTFITFEGLDASGKSSLAYSLKQELEKLNNTVYIINRKDINYDPNTFIGNRLQLLDSLLWKCNVGDDLTEVPPICWIYLNATWHTIVSHNFIEPLRKKAIVIADSWIYKRIARFELADKINREHLLSCYKDVEIPDLTFFMDIPPSKTWHRREKHSRKDFGFLQNGNVDAMQETFISYQQKIYDNLKRYSIENNWERLDASKSIKELTDEVLSVMDRRLE